MGLGKFFLKNYLHFCTLQSSKKVQPTNPVLNYIIECLEKCFLNISALVDHLRAPTIYQGVSRTEDFIMNGSIS